MEYYYNPYELYHHGILGMKWGVRRWQNKDGSLTPAGRKRYNVDIAGAQEKLKQAKKDYKRLKSNMTKIKFAMAKEKLLTEKAKEKINKEIKTKSKYRLKLEEEYRNRGMTDEEAEIEAYKYVRTRKNLAIAAVGVTVAIAAAYVAYKKYDKATNRIIKPGTLIRNISGNNNKGVQDAFYATLKKNPKSQEVTKKGLMSLKTGKVDHKKSQEAKNALYKKIKSATANSTIISYDELEADYISNIKKAQKVN